MHWAATSEPVRLFVKEVPLKVLGKELTVIAIEQADGTQGYSPEKADGFHVEVVNQLKVPTSIHWHGLILPNLMDGVPFVTQNPIAPGKSFRYDFPLKQSGTYWMHSHYGLQEQVYNSAPLIIWTPEERAKADRQVVVMFSDFSFTPPEQILKGLKRGMQPTNMKESPPGKKMEAGSSETKSGMQGGSSPNEVVAQKWDDQKQRLVRTMLRAPEAEIDVKYDALLANRRTLDDPEIISVNAGESVLLRLIAASSNQNFYVDTGGLEAELLAVDGKAVQPIKGNFFQLGVAQRLDLKVTIPKEGGAFPILAQGEGTKLLGGVVLTTKGASVPKLSRKLLSRQRRSTIPRKRGSGLSIRFPTAPLIARSRQCSAETWLPTFGPSTARLIPIATLLISRAASASEWPSLTQPTWDIRCICMGMTSKFWRLTAKRYPERCAIHLRFRQVRK